VTEEASHNLPKTFKQVSPIYFNPNQRARRLEPKNFFSATRSTEGSKDEDGVLNFYHTLKQKGKELFWPEGAEDGF
jgi:hypothetical protein